MRLEAISRIGLMSLGCLALGARPANQGIDIRMEDFLRLHAGFGDRELAEARSGERVVKTLDPGIPQEMVTAGVTRFDVPFDYYFERARTGDLYRAGPTLVELGRFSPDPTTADLEGLTLDHGDLEALGEPDPAAAKEALVRRVREFRNQGIRRHFAAQAEAYAANYPPAEANLAAEYFAWAKVNIGLKKLVRLTKVTLWERRNGPRRESVMVTEQVYASRYFQASLQVDHVIAEDGGAPAICLVTINRGRCDLLGSAIARLLRPLIMSRTRASTQRTLDLAKLVIESEYQGLHSERNGEAGRPPALVRLQSGLSAQP